MSNIIEITAYFEKGAFGNLEYCEYTFYKELPNGGTGDDFGQLAGYEAKNNQIVNVITALGWRQSKTISSLSDLDYRGCRISKNHNQGFGVSQHGKFHWETTSGIAKCTGFADSIKDCKFKIDLWLVESDYEKAI